MEKELTVYVRDNEYNPKGVVCMGLSKLYVEFEKGEDTTPIIVVGWSKAHKSDVFIKKMGRVIALKRAEKAEKYISDNITIDDPISNGHIKNLDVDISNIPYIIMDALETCFDKAKRVYGIDRECLFVVPSITHEHVIPDNISLQATLKHLENTIEGKNLRQLTTYNYIKY